MNLFMAPIYLAACSIPEEAEAVEAFSFFFVEAFSSLFAPKCLRLYFSNTSSSSFKYSSRAAAHTALERRKYRAPEPKISKPPGLSPDCEKTWIVFMRLEITPVREITCPATASDLEFLPGRRQKLGKQSELRNSVRRLGSLSRCKCKPQNTTFLTV